MHVNRTIEEFNAKRDEDKKQGRRSLDVIGT